MRRRSVQRSVFSVQFGLRPHAGCRPRTPCFISTRFSLNTEHRTLNTARRAPRAAFTLIEIVSVLGIIVVLLTLALGAYHGWSRAAGMGDAAGILVAGLDHAREIAITRRVETRLFCDNVAPYAGRPMHGAFAISTVETETNNVLPFLLAAPTNYLPAEVRFAEAPREIFFRTDGTCRPSAFFESDGRARLTIEAANSGGRRLARIVEVQQLTGRTRVRREDAP